MNLEIGVSELQAWCLACFVWRSQASCWETQCSQWGCFGATANVSSCPFYCSLRSSVQRDCFMVSVRLFLPPVLSLRNADYAGGGSPGPLSDRSFHPRPFALLSFALRYVTKPHFMHSIYSNSQYF